MYFFKKKGLICIIIFFAASLTAKEACPAQVYNNKGLFYMHQKKHKLAEDYFFKAVKCNSSVSLFYNNRAVALIHLKRYKEAEMMIISALKLRPDYMKALSNLASIHYYRGEYRKAYSVYKKIYMKNQKFIKKRFPREKIISRIKVRSKRNSYDWKLKEILQYLN
jgi:tetratricopeptide (TPR) repeat protein